MNPIPALSTLAINWLIAMCGMLPRLVRMLRANLIHTFVLCSGELDVRLSGNSVSGHYSDCRLRDSKVPRTRSTDMHLWMAVHSKHATLLWNVAFRRTAESRLM